MTTKNVCPSKRHGPGIAVRVAGLPGGRGRLRTEVRERLRTEVRGRLRTGVRGLAVAVVALAAASCSGIAPIGPASSATTSSPRHLKSPLVFQVMRSQPNTAAGGCRAGWHAVVMPRGAAPAGCYRPVSAPLTITSAAISAVSARRPAPVAGQPRPPTMYVFTVGVPTAKVAAVSELITRAYNAGGALGISVDGKLWQAPHVIEPFPGQRLQIAMLSRNLAVRLHRLLVSSG